MIAIIVKFISVLPVVVGGVYLLVSMKRVRLHAHNLSETTEENVAQWRRGNVLIFVLLIISVCLLPIVIIFLQAMLGVVYAGVCILGFSIAYHHITRTSLREIARHQKQNREQLARQQESVQLLEKYIPTTLHAILAKKSSQEISRGDSAEMRSGILLVDFHDYIASQNITDKQREFRYTSECMHEAGKILYEHGCIMIQGMGYGLIAIFTRNALGAIDAAIAVNAHLNSLVGKAAGTEQDAAQPNYTLLQGLSVVGLVSHGNALQSLIVSEALDLAYQLQRLTRRLHIPIVLDDFSRRMHEKLDRYTFRYIGMVENKMNGQVIRTHEVLDLYPDMRREKFLRNKDEFESARRAQENGEFQKAYSQYSSVLTTNPHDFLAQHFQRQCSNIMTQSAVNI